MTRGRPRNLALTPTRALENQRNYRERRAALLKQLEADNARLEGENAALRRELDAAWRRCAELQAEAAGSAGCGRAARADGDAHEAGALVRAAHAHVADALAMLDEAARRSTPLARPPTGAAHGGTDWPLAQAAYQPTGVERAGRLAQSTPGRAADGAGEAGSARGAETGPPPDIAPEPAMTFELDASKCCFGAVDCP